LIFLGFFKPKMTALWLANQTRGVVALWKFKRKNPLELRATTPLLFIGDPEGPESDYSIP